MKRIRSFTIPDGMTFSDFKLALYIRRTNKRCAADRKRWETFMRRYARVIAEIKERPGQREA